MDALVIEGYRFRANPSRSVNIRARRAPTGVRERPVDSDAGYDPRVLHSA